MKDMNPEADRQERNRESVRRWYAAHREEYAELRRKRYQSDPKRRKAARDAAARYRKERQKGLKVSRVLMREINGVPVEVFTPGYIADRIGTSAQVLRSWEEREWIPVPIFEDAKHRLYTGRQVALIRLLADTLKARGGTRRAAEDPGLDEVINVIHKTWRVIDGPHAAKSKTTRSRKRRSS
jgi:hypothetical protein